MNHQVSDSQYHGELLKQGFLNETSEPGSLCESGEFQKIRGAKMVCSI